MQLGLVRVNLHDVVVKQIGARWVMLLAYWDGGYVQLDVTAEFTADDQFFLATDEDFAPYGATDFEIKSGPNAGGYPSVPCPVRPRS